MKISRRTFTCLLAGVALAVSVGASAADWPQAKGPNRNGVSSDTGLLRAWTQESLPQLAWKNSSVGQTMNGVSVVGNFVYTIGTKGSMECVICIDQTSGKTLWARPIGKVASGRGAKFPLQRSTPTVYKNKIYAMGSSGNLVCLNTGNGATFWVRSVIATMGGVMPPYGYCESPYVDGKWVIVCPGGPNASMVAIGRHWGENVWVAKAGLPGSCTSIIKASFGGEHQYVTFSSGGLYGVKVRGGDVRWRYEAPSHASGYNGCAPIWFGQTILASSAAGTGCVWLQKDGTTYKAQEVWFNEDLKVPTGDMVKVNDYVFACNDELGLFCFNYKTGETVWSDKSLFEEEAEDADGKGSRKSGTKSGTKSGAKPGTRPTTPRTRTVPQASNVTVDEPYLGMFAGANCPPGGGGASPSESDSAAAGRQMMIPQAPKTKKRAKLVPPPKAPDCMATMTYAEGLLYVRTSNGLLALVEATADGMKVRGRIALPQFKDGLPVTPVIANGFLYLREGGTVFCFDIRDKSRQAEDAEDAESDGKGGSGRKALPGMPTDPGVKQRTAPGVG